MYLKKRIYYYIIKLGKSTRLNLGILNKHIEKMGKNNSFPLLIFVKVPLKFGVN